MPNGASVSSTELKEHIAAAAVSGDVALMSRLVASAGAAAVRGDGSAELTPLHLAANAGHVHLVHYLLAQEVRADPRARRGNNFTPLHAAAMSGRTQVCKLLLAAGADVNAQTSPQGYAPMHSAAFAGHLDTIKVLLCGGANRHIVNYRGETPEATARRQNQVAVANYLAAEDGL
jgi:ankyrin repeat protein